MYNGPVMARIVATVYHPTRPPRKRKPQPAITAPIVTVEGKPSWFGDVPAMTPEEHRRRGDAADAVLRELVRRAKGSSCAGGQPSSALEVLWRPRAAGAA